MTLTPEEQRALDYQHQARRRMFFQRSLQAKLLAPSANRVRLEKAWEPLRRTHG